MSKAETRSIKNKQQSSIYNQQSNNISKSTTGEPYISKYYGNLVRNGKLLLSNHYISTTKLIAFSNHTTNYAKNAINKILDNKNKQLIQNNPYSTKKTKYKD